LLRRNFCVAQSNTNKGVAVAQQHLVAQLRYTAT
jgi:hypothetical protein